MRSRSTAGSTAASPRGAWRTSPTPPSPLTYNLYSDRPGGIVWDNTTGVAATGNGNDQWYPIYGLVPAQTTPVAGTYRDTVNVTISW